MLPQCFRNTVRQQSSYEVYSQDMDRIDMHVYIYMCVKKQTKLHMVIMLNN